MSKNENSRPRRQPGTGQHRAGPDRVDRVPCFHSTTAPAGRQVRMVSDALPKYREHALKMSDLKLRFGLDSRTLRLMIQRERRHVPILSDNMSGYWISNDEAEVRHFSNSMRHRARQIWRTAANVEKAAGLTRSAHQIEGQGTLDGWGNE